MGQQANGNVCGQTQDVFVACLPQGALSCHTVRLHIQHPLLHVQVDSRRSPVSAVHDTMTFCQVSLHRGPEGQVCKGPGHRAPISDDALSERVDLVFKSKPMCSEGLHKEPNALQDSLTL